MPLGKLPLITIFMVSGTRSQIFPVAKITAISLRPMPVARAPNAP